VNRCRVTATDDVPILTAQAHCHTCASGRSRSVIKSEITPAHKPADLRGQVCFGTHQLRRADRSVMSHRRVGVLLGFAPGRSVDPLGSSAGSNRK